MGFYRISILSSALTQVLPALKHTPRQIIACRDWYTEKKSSLVSGRISSEIPYLYKRERVRKTVTLRKASVETEGDFSKVLAWVNSENAGDLTVSSLSVFIDSQLLKEVAENALGYEIPAQKFVCRFVLSTDTKKIYKLKRKVAENMSYQIKNLRFKTDNLDLVAIHAKEDYLGQRKFNLLEKIQPDKKLIKELCEELLNSFINVGEIRMDVRAIKYYGVSSKDVIILEDAEIV